MCKMLLAIFAERINDARRARGHLFAFFLLAVQNAQRVFLQPFPAGFAKLVLPRPEIFHQRRVILRPAVGAADGVDVQLQIMHAKVVEHCPGQIDDLRVRRRILGAKDLQDVYKRQA